MGRDHADALTGTVIVAASLVLAFLTTRFVEQPLRAWRWPEAKRRRLAVAVLVCLGVAAAPLVQFGYQQQLEKNLIAHQDADDNPGARALLPGYVDLVREGARTLPTPEQLPEDWGKLDGPCTGELAPRIRCFLRSASRTTSALTLRRQFLWWASPIRCNGSEQSVRWQRKTAGVSRPLDVRGVPVHD